MSRLFLSAGTGITLLALALIGTAPGAHAAEARPAMRLMERTELYFGSVPLQEWNAFLADVVTPRFPDGLTWFDVHGQWRGPSGEPEKLPSRLLIVLHADNPHNERALEEIGRLFLQRFGLAVLRASVTVKASDPDWSEQRGKDNPQLSSGRKQP